MGSAIRWLVAIEDWRWIYNNIRPHRSLGYVTPLEFTREQSKETESSQCWAYRLPTASLLPNINNLYNINHIINTSRLTKALAQFA
ncbi:integrase core domain-containing protein [Candidatus Pelagisphaera phototrophica]|uniref:integrase core domain-containing protein n=1 Tax=Candidatus Pelagisphaera phototrophica TaxID=2684113 RepID=UPI001A08BD2A|nr:integrase core domain-containing protein [Candidatus Pelagisphaera phototrophica]